ncbi:branched-chain amino acid ABC transporter permease [Hoyosella altamirensis]|uniref:Branched-chain amino acid transport system permease protein n=1 Tax=Hoyosella altamirensis TaxID=616997 RepID=A0A839RRI7_9ACTN|nr:branched-chain amino acid ABC transporter permease [Hoyosella altamirensis]MBB3038716.1 branched-chain amino acid transport system permease protein [Hoyosella altamirensis]
MDFLGIDFGIVFSNAFAQFVGPQAIFFALLAIGLNVHFGYTGLLNFGQIGFALVSAYGVGITVVIYNQPLWLGLIVGMAASVVLALLLGIPTLRLRADYLAIVTIAASEILRLATRSTASDDYTRGTRGIQGQNFTFQAMNPFSPGREYTILGVKFLGSTLWAMVVGWALIAILLVLIWMLVNSPWGRALKAVREDEDAARALGKNVFFYRMQALVLGGFIGGLAGIFIALTQALNPDFFSTQQTFFAWTAMILGGAATVFGPVVGAMVFWFLFSFIDNVLRQLSSGPDAVIPISAQQVGAVQIMLVGILLAVLIVYRPQGIMGRKREVQLNV